MNRYLLLAAIFAASGAQALGNCEFEKRIDDSLDVSNSLELAVTAAAGDLEIVGIEGLDKIRIKATVCASKNAWAKEATVEASGGDHATIVTAMPHLDWNLFGGGQYMYIDLQLEVPAVLPLNIHDSSGDIDLRGVSALHIKDSSGDIEATDVRGNVVLEDSSGDIDIEGVEGDVTVYADSSGDIHGSDIRGSVLVVKDSSGDIRFRQVKGDFVVERDSSGDIVARDIGGDFRVLKDGSGVINGQDVAGEVQIPDKG